MLIAPRNDTTNRVTMRKLQNGSFPRIGMSGQTGCLLDIWLLFLTIWSWPHPRTYLTTGKVFWSRNG